MPVKLNIFRVMAHAESCVIPQMRLGTAILGSLDLGHRRRELLILLVARIEGGTYEWRQHVPIALGVGVPKAQIDAIEQANLADNAFDDAERALLAFGKQVIEAVRVEEGVFTQARRHFSEREIVEAILTIGFYMTMARLTEATETDLDPAAGMTVFDSLQPPEASA
ncbi:carboxymuconolactone decarboxylase family protein [Nonomuraea sp. NPDC049695]|uniref:carboxymuconolactone decarboxylase family protein n=1 Tax=Nonomuraea sp. NPDC049695 TaxID=3154734 RepID=UPI003435DBC6